MLKQSIYLSFLNFAGRGFNFFIYWLMANKFGADQTTDWFFFIYAIIYFINTIFIKSVENVFVPTLSEKGTSSVYPLFRYVCRSALWGSFLIALISLLAGFVIAPMFVGVESQLPVYLGIVICIVLSFQPGLALLSAFFSSFLQSRQQYFLPTIHLSLRSVGIMPFLLLAACKTTFCLAWAFLAGELLRFVILGQNIFKRLVELRKKNALQKDIFDSSIFHHIGWVSLALAATQLNPTIDLAMVGNIGQGSITLVDYTSKIRGIPILALGGILTILLGEWSAQHLKNKSSLSLGQIFKVTLIVMTLALLASGLLLGTVERWVPIVFYSNKFSSSDIASISRLMVGYLPGVPFLAGYFVLSKAILVFQQTRVIAYVALGGIVLNIIFNLVFLHFLGLVGVAVSTSCIDIAAFVVMAIFVIRQCNRQTQNI